MTRKCPNAYHAPECPGDLIECAPFEDRHGEGRYEIQVLRCSVCGRESELGQSHILCANVAMELSTLAKTECAQLRKMVSQYEGTVEGIRATLAAMLERGDR